MTQVYEAHNRVIVSFLQWCKEVRGQPQRDRGRTLGTMCTREEHTFIKRRSWGPSKDSVLRMVKWESQSKTTPQSPEDGHIYCILLIHIVFCHVSKFLLLHCLFYDTMNIYFCIYFNSARNVLTGLLIFVNIYHFTYTFSHTHIEAHTHMHTCVISTQEE